MTVVRVCVGAVVVDVLPTKGVDGTILRFSCRNSSRMAIPARKDAVGPPVRPVCGYRRRKGWRCCGMNEDDNVG
jgi:hypothetical protein